MNSRRENGRFYRRTNPFPPAILWAILSVLLTCPPGAYGQHHDGNDEAPVVLDTMVVNAERIEDYVQSNPNQVVVLGRDEILQRNMLSVEEALGTMPGVDVKRSPGIGARISIRGSGKSTGVLVLLNGRPLNNSQYGVADLSVIPIDMVASITVFKPPVPVWLGPGASQGAISIETRTSTAKDKDEKKNTTRVRTSGGSYGLTETSASHRAKLDSGSLMVSASANHRDGKRTNNDRDNGNAALHYDKEIAAVHRLEFDARYSVSENGSVGPLDNPTPDARQSYDKGSIDSRISGVIGDSGDYAVNLYADTIHLEDESQSGFTSTLDDEKYGLKWEYNWSDAQALWAVGANGLLEHDHLDHTLSGRHHRDSAGLGVQADRNWKTVTLTFSARGDDTSGFGLNPGFSAGLRYALARDWSLKVNAGYTVSIPTFGQLYQPSHGSIDQVRGNPDLAKEKIYSTDATLEFRPNKSHLFQVTFFRSDTHDPILYRRGSDLIFQPTNGDRSWRHGLGATWKYLFDAGLSIDANAIVQDSQVEETGNELTYTPKVQGKLTFQYTFKRPGTRLETSIRYCGEQFSEMENRESQRLDDYITADIKAVQPFTVKQIAAEWFLNVDNLFDNDYEVHFGYPDDGIRFVSGLNLTF